MAIETAIQTIIVGDSDVAALIGTNSYAGHVPQGTDLPYVTTARIATVKRLQSLTARSGVTAARFQVDAWAAVYSGAVDLANKLRIALDRFKGTVGAESINGIFIQDTFDGQEMITKGREQPVHVVSQDFLVWHAEATS